MLFCGISDRQHPPLLTGSQVRFVFGEHALYTDMCDLDSELLLLSCRRRGGSQEDFRCKAFFEIKTHTQAKTSHTLEATNSSQTAYGMALDGRASTRSPKL